jgi:hypothetical protein
MTSEILKNLGFKETGLNCYRHKELEKIIFLDKINEASDIVKFIYKEGIFEGEHQTTKRCSNIIAKISGNIIANLFDKKHGAERLEKIKDEIDVVSIEEDEN